MKRYSVFALAREALSYHMGWEKAWRSPAPKASYDAIIVGAGGHGLQERLAALEYSQADKDFARSAYARLERPLADMAGIIGFAVKVQNEAATKKLGRDL